MMIIFELEVVDVDSDLKVLGNFLNIGFWIVLMGGVIVVLFMFIVIVIVIIAKNVPGITANVSLCISFCTVTVTVTIHG